MNSTSLLKLIADRALVGAENLPATQRADVLDGVALIFAKSKQTQKLSDAAATAAKQIREAESAQLLFRSIMQEVQS